MDRIWWGPLNRWRFFAVLTPLLAADLWTKRWAELAIGKDGRLDVVHGFLSFVYSLNRGSVGGVLDGQQRLLVGIAAITVGVIIYYLARAEGRGAAAQVVLSILGAGVLGNLHDRLFHPERAVRDFIDMYVGTHHWPTYNLADVYIVLGAAAIFIASFRAPRREGAPSEAVAAK